VIGVAIGMLMNQHNITRDQALKLLRLLSQASNRKLRDLAEQLADTGALPPVP
jgi:AmiR/NasT family two-component response regulator